REVIGADAFRAVSGADLTFTLRGAFGIALGPFNVVEAGPQHFERLRLVLMLRFLILLLHGDAGRQMGYPDRDVGGDDGLAAGPVTPPSPVSLTCSSSKRQPWRSA